MHSPYSATTLTSLEPAAILRLDRALRRARERILGGGATCDALWSVLIELAASDDGLAFEALEAGPARHFGRTTLLGCLSTLEELGLIKGRKRAEQPLLSHVRITPCGLKRIDEVIQSALEALRRYG
ncbi:MAG: hypothetical protein ABL914_04010 [Novosphingobium sp.]|uniref:hypothetical protein n=1 Tax=Novosphingobium sp. TaxID=1874826 RepID=UPI0032BAC5ED